MGVFKECVGFYTIDAIKKVKVMPFNPKALLGVYM